ncbi:MAG TPA: response regulator, partial [Bryobacteraceae bacterium]|nr:response regulator [Bryobacteraceae bacterium]
ELYEEQTRLRARAEESERRAGFLAQATAILASSLDYETTLLQVARLAVPGLADWCSVEILEADGSIRQLALAHADPSKLQRAAELRRQYPPFPNEAYGVPRVLATGVAELVPEITAGMLERTARDATHLSMLREIGLTSYLCVPMLARNRVLGAIVFVSAESGRRYGPEDLATAEHLGRRAALSVDNALLYETARRSEARFRRLGEAGVLGIFMGDGERITEANDLFLDMLGYTREDLAAGLVSWPEITAPEYAAADARAIEQLTGSGACAPYEKEYLRKDGTRVPVLLGAVMLDPPPSFTWVSFAIDLTGRKRLESRLREAQKLESIGLLAGGVAHDFNNLLTGILGNASLALEDIPKGSPIEPILENVVNAAERAAYLTRQLLAYSGRGRFVIQPVNLTALIHDLAPLLKVSLPKRVHLRLNLDEGVPPVHADANQLQQLLMDLILNGAEAIGNGIGSVSITTRAEEVGPEYAAGPLTADEFTPGPCVRLEVEDSGCGMDSQTMARIFDPFFTTKFTGRGLGLAAALGIVRGHHGDIQVWSEPGRGSRFQVLLPVAPEPAVGPVSSVPEAALQGTGTILLADDEDVVLETGRRALNRYGYRVLVARDGREAVEVLREHAAEVSLVLLDMTMPVMGGDEALGHLRRIRPEVPVIVSTGYSETEAQRRFGERGTVYFIQKPYSAAKLAEIVKESLEGKARALGANE